MAEWLLWACVPLLTAMNQAAMKWAAGALSAFPFGLQWLEAAAHCPWLWGALACEIVNFIIWLTILKRHALSVAFSLSSIGYVSVLAASWYFFNEPMRLLQLLGVMTILAGIMTIGYQPRKD